MPIAPLVRTDPPAQDISCELEMAGASTAARHYLDRRWGHCTWPATRQRPRPRSGPF